MVKHKSAVIGNIGHMGDVLSVSDTRFLLAATGPVNHAPAGHLEALARQVENWPATIKMARRHGVFLCFAQALFGLSENALPSGLAASVHAQVTQQTLIIMSNISELLRICQLLKGANIPVALVKGPALSVELNGKAAGRDRGDLDIMVRGADVARADGILRAVGYDREGAAVLDPDSTFTQVLLGATNDRDYRHPQKLARLELHWRWHRNPYALPFDPEMFWGGLREIEIADQKVSVPALDQLWLYLASHGGRHRWFRLKWITDIRHALTNPEFVAALSDALILSRSMGGQRALAVAVLLAEKLNVLAGYGAPVNIAPELRADRAAQKLAHRFYTELLSDGRLVLPDTSIWKEIRAEWCLTSSMWRRFAMIWHRVMAPSERDAMSIVLPVGLIWAYPLLRPLLWGWRQIAKSRKPVSGPDQ